MNATIFQLGPAGVLLAALVVALLLGAAARVERRRRREAAGRQAAERDREARQEALDALPDGVVVYGADERVVYWNSRYERIFPELLPVLRIGASLVEIREFALRQMLPAAAGPDHPAWPARPPRPGAPEPTPVRLALRDGRVVQVVDRPTASGGFVSTVRDVTDLEGAAHAQQRMRQRLEQALDAMSDAFVVFDADERLVLWNRRYVELFPYLAGRLQAGMSHEEIGVIASQALFPGADELQRAAFRNLRRDQRYRGEAGSEQQLPDGRIVAPIDRRGEDGSVVTLFRDVTQLRRATRDIEHARDQAQQAAHAKSRFLASMSEEIRTPLDEVLGMTARLQQGALTEEQRPSVARIAEAGGSLLSVVNDILDFSRLDARKLPLAAVPLAPAAVVRDVVAELAPEAQAKGLALADEVAIDFVPAVLGDPHRLRQVLRNIARHAIRSTARGGVRIEARQRAVGERRVSVEISVRDSSPGLAPAALERLFTDLPAPVADAPRDPSSSGLELAIARGLVALMGGEILAESRPGEGTTLRVQIEFELADATGTPVP